MRYRLWGRVVTDEEQVANAKESFVDLTPASQAPAIANRANWAALLPGQTIPLIGERVAHITEEE
jgi:hypothetical protein